MASLASMPPLYIDQDKLAAFGTAWFNNGENLSRTPPHSSGELGRLFDYTVGTDLAIFLGGISIMTPHPNALMPPHPDCVEVGNVRIVGGVRPQNFDVGYRPDGVRFAFDSKTLNEKKSIGKNWQNMVNDLATEATTVHSRFPHAIVAFLVACPSPCLTASVQKPLIETLERLARRISVDGADYMAEAIAMVAWNPTDGTISTDVPVAVPPLRIEKFSAQVELMYTARYKGLPPHTE